MTEEAENLDRVIDQFGTIADDAFRIMRLNILIIGIYVSGVVAVSRYEEAIVVTRLVESTWTQGGLILWLFSVMFAYFTYEPSRRASVPHLYENPGRVIAGTKSAYQSFKLRVAFTFTITGSGSLAIGVWDGFIPVGIALGVVWTLVWGLIFTGALILMASRYGLRFYEWVINQKEETRVWISDRIP